jgi:hypothetical protein
LELVERTITVPVAPAHRQLIGHIENACALRLRAGETPLRLAIASVDDNKYVCEIGCLIGEGNDDAEPTSIFSIRKRAVATSSAFNAVFIVPTGIGAEVGGHAGDATPAAQLLASCCDQLVTHPNVVNASDVNELPLNALYVEGSVLSRLMMGTVGLAPARSNRLMVVFDSQDDAMIENLVLNTVESARATYGLTCAGVHRLDPPLELTATLAASGRAIGTGRGLDGLFELLGDAVGDYDAVAITSLIGVPDGLHQEYFNSDGGMINPWGGVEAMLTHATSHRFNVPSAHAPMMESREILNEDPGRVDPRMAAEAISSSFLQCVLKGLKRSPRIVTDPDHFLAADTVSAEDIDCLVTPAGCFGLPVLAALEQGITVIAVNEGAGLRAGDLGDLPWHDHQFFVAENYWEAAGILSALRAGIDPKSVRRPLTAMEVHQSQREPESEISSPSDRRLSGVAQRAGD